MPLLASYHTELATYAGLRSGDDGARGARPGPPSAPSTAPRRGPLAEPRRRRLAARARRRRRRGSAAGSAASTSTRFDPAKADRDAFPGEIKVLYAGRLTREKGVDLLAESFLRAHEADPRLHLLLAGGGPEEGELRERLGERATFLGWLDGEELPRAYASADAFLFASSTDTYGQVILEAGASGLPVVAVAEGGPAALIENRHTGLLCRPDADHLAGAAAAARLLAARCARQLGAAAARAARERSWERSMEQLAAGYRRALDAAAAAAPQPLARAA